MTPHDGGPAMPGFRTVTKTLPPFVPLHQQREAEVNEPVPGMSKLEVYAKAAMEGMLANPNTTPGDVADTVIAAAWRAAEKMLAEYERRRNADQRLAPPMEQAEEGDY